MRLDISAFLQVKHGWSGVDSALWPSQLRQQHHTNTFSLGQLSQSICHVAHPVTKIPTRCIHETQIIHDDQFQA